MLQTASGTVNGRSDTLCFHLQDHRDKTDEGNSMNQSMTCTRRQCVLCAVLVYTLSRRDCTVVKTLVWDMSFTFPSHSLSYLWFPIFTIQTWKSIDICFYHQNEHSSLQHISAIISKKHNNRQDSILMWRTPLHSYVILMWDSDITTPSKFCLGMLF